MKFIDEEGRENRKPIRQCALTRLRSREDDLLRFVLDPENRVVPDIKRKLPGRGVWITATYQCVANAVRKNVFSRSFKRTLAPNQELAELAGLLLRRSALQDLALTNKSGCAVSGYTKVESAIKAGKVLALLHAFDSSRDGRDKLDRLARAVASAKDKDFAHISCFTCAELSLALGKGNVNHSAIADGGAGRTFLRSANRYIIYMGSHSAAGPIADAPVQEKA